MNPASRDCIINRSAQEEEDQKQYLQCRLPCEKTPDRRPEEHRGCRQQHKPLMRLGISSLEIACRKEDREGEHFREADGEHARPIWERTEMTPAHPQDDRCRACTDQRYRQNGTCQPQTPVEASPSY